MLYLDHNSTTFTHPEIKKLIIKLIDGGLNPSSIHINGRLAKKIIEDARGKIAEAVGISLNDKKSEIIFTASGTESNNLVMKSFYDGEIFISSIEHLSIYNHIKYAPNIKLIKVNKDGLVDFTHLEELLFQSKSPKKLVSVMLANNESGVIQDIAGISQLAKKYSAEMHSDCIQAFGKIPVNINELKLDFCTISGHKIGAGQGCSALITNSLMPVTPTIIGGGQEKNMRSGTENVLAIACFGVASSIVVNEMAKKIAKIKELQEVLESHLAKYQKVKIISGRVERLPNTTLFTVLGTDAQIKLIAFDLKNICISSGSACSSGKIAKSHVLSAMGVDDEEVRSSIRVSLGSDNTLEDIEIFISAFEEIYKQELI